MGGPLRVLGLLLLATGAPVMAQKAVLSASNVTLAYSGSENTTGQRKIFSEIADPNSGARWIIWRDPAHPGGPGRLVPAQPEAGSGALEDRESGSDHKPVIAAPCIHVGDKIVVEEHTAAADVSLEAVAMEPAQSGSPFQARLRVGGKVVGAVAVAPGRATLASAAEVKR
jgi:hypothetical protein